MLSPANYIRQKARNLPIYECRLNKDWEDSGLAHITVARKHTNGNITFGVYLVDLKLLGVKDAFYQFNINETEYHELIQDLKAQLDTDTAPYKLVHNIIFAGIEFADDYGFKPHKDFTSVAQFILEEDTDEVELIDIECGNDDKPLYVRGPHETEAQANKIIAQLEREAGPGNYEVVWQTEEDFVEEDSWDDDKSWMDNDVDEIEEKFEGLSTTEKVELIGEMFHQITDPTEKQSEELAYLANSVINNYLDFDLLNSLSALLTDKLLEYEISDEFSDELLGIEPDSNINREKWEKQFLELYSLTSDKPKSAEKKIKKLQKNMPENPAPAFLELMALQGQKSSKFEEKVKKYYTQFPDYPLFKLLKTPYELLNDKNADAIDFFKRDPENYFGKRKSINHIELFHYLFVLIIIASTENNITLIEAAVMIIDEMEIPEEDNHILAEISTISKMNFVLSLSEETHNTSHEKNSKREEAKSLQFKIQLKGIKKPPVWRRVTVPSNYSFYDLHLIIQKAFGWWNSHLFQFSEKGFGSYQIITEIYDEFEPDFNEQIPAKEIKISDVFKREKQKFVYIYDFGDSWEHDITLEKINTEKSRYPSLLDGKGKCPPEDCGGVWGYEGFKEIMADKKHPEYAEYSEWCGLEDDEEWNPNELDLEARQSAIRNLF
jgi:hypothetical protein